MSRGHFRRRGGYFRGVSNDVSRDLRGCLSVSAKIDLTPHSLHHSSPRHRWRSPFVVFTHMTTTTTTTAADEVENAGTQRDVVRAISPGVATLACQINLRPREGYTHVLTISLELCVFKDPMTLGDERFIAGMLDTNRRAMNNTLEWYTWNAR